MRAMVGIFYWLVVGLLILFAVYLSVAESRLWPGLLVPAALLVFGAYPALLITRAVLLQIYSSDWACSSVDFDGISNPNGGFAVRESAGCTTVSMDLLLFGIGLWTVALLGAVLLYRQPRPTGA